MAQKRQNMVQKRQNNDLIPKIKSINSTQWIEEICFRGVTAPVVVLPTAHQGNIEWHVHDFTELIIILDGMGIHDFRNKSYKLKPGDCFLIEPGMQHAYRSTEGLKLMNILIRSSFMKAYGPILKADPAYRALAGKVKDEKQGASHRPSLSPEELDVCVRIVTDLERERKEMRKSHTTMMAARLLELFVRIFRSSQSANTIKDDMRSPWLAKVLDYLEIHFAEEIPISRLQKLAGMTERSFQRHFLKMKGLTPLRYIMHLRIARACRLLREENKTVYEAASLCGMQNCSYFCRLFRKTTGHSPKEYARLSKKAEK